jgi:hypothetical protein
MKKISINKFTMEQLEPRLMFSADVQAVPFDGGLPHEDGVVDFSVVETDLVPNTIEPRIDVMAENQRHELMFVDAGVSDYQQLVDDLMAHHDDGRKVEVIILDSDRDGIEQISESLARYRDIDAVHVVSHGRDGSIQLGNALLTQDSLDDYADSIEGWRNALTGKADILFYGCDLAAGKEGRDALFFSTSTWAKCFATLIRPRLYPEGCVPLSTPWPKGC